MFANVGQICLRVAFSVQRRNFYYYKSVLISPWGLKESRASVTTIRRFHTNDQKQGSVEVSDLYTHVFSKIHENKLSATTSEPKLLRKKTVITILGHVDHGKTTLLDHIRRSSIAQNEQGGITQKIGAFYSNIKPGHQVVFLDTPGHHLFSSMRLKSTLVTDMSILVVAWHDGIMPQTKESIDLLLKNDGLVNRIKLTPKNLIILTIPFIVAINKCDKHLPETRKRELIESLSSFRVYTEDIGGMVPVVCISAKTGLGIDKLADNILALEEVCDIKVNYNGPAQGLILETSKDAFLGLCATIIINEGILKKGETIVSGNAYCIVRKFLKIDGSRADILEPSDVAQVFGWKMSPQSGKAFIAAPKEYDEKQLKKLILQSKLPPPSPLPQPKQFSERRCDQKLTSITEDKKVSNNVLRVFIKADSHGTIEAIKKAILGLKYKNCDFSVLVYDIGPPKLTDLEKCKLLNAHILLFNVKANENIMHTARSMNVKIDSFSVIYAFLDFLRDLIFKTSAYVKKIENTGVLNVLKIYMIYSKKVNNVISGVKVASGKVKVGDIAEVIRGSKTMHKGKILTIKSFDKVVDSVEKGNECGVIIENFNEISEGDKIMLYSYIEYKEPVEYLGDSLDEIDMSVQ